MASQKRPLRVAAYLRYSSEEQRGNTTLATQLKLIQEWVERKGAILIRIYTDEAKSGRTLNKRDAFKELLADAKSGEFDTVCVAMWSRLARDGFDSFSTKEYLRKDCNLFVYSASEGDTIHESAAGGFNEDVMAAVAAYYSNELSEKYRRAKREIFERGHYLGSRRPFGYDMVKPERYTDLIINEVEAAAVLLAYETYAAGKHSLVDIASMLNDMGLKTTRGGLHNVDGVKEMLSNPLYIGQLSHKESRYSSNKQRMYDNPIETTQGRHKAIVPVELFNKVQEMKEYRQLRKRKTGTVSDASYSYMLGGLVYCWRCVQEGRNGKCHCRTALHRNKKNFYSRYTCVARRNGYTCAQGEVKCETIDEQVLFVLRSLQLPQNWRKQLIEAIAAETQTAEIAARLNELHQIIENMDFRFDYGLIVDKQEYLTKRAELQREYDKLKPAANTDLLENAADLIDNFTERFEACNGDIDEQNRLISRIISRVYVEGKQVVGIMFVSDIHAVLHNGGAIAKFYSKGELELVDYLTDEQLATPADLEAKHEAAHDENLLLEELREKYPTDTPQMLMEKLGSLKVRPEGFEPTTTGSEDRCSIH